MIEQLPHGEELKYAVFDVLQAVVILVQNLCGLLEVEMIFAPLVPRQFGDGLEVGANDLSLHGVLGRPLKSPQLTIDFFACLHRKLQLLNALPQLVCLLGIVVPQLFLDGLELLPQEHLPLPLADLLLDLRFDLLLCLSKLQLSLHVNQHPPEPLFHTTRLEQRLSFGGGNVYVSSYQVGEATRLFHAIEHLLDDFLR